MQAFSRLTDTFTPSNYNLSIKLNRKERSFSGLVTIQGELLKGDYIPLHTKDLTINSVTLDGKNTEFTFADNDELRIANHNNQNSQHIIVVDFEGKITDAMHGLYSCYFEVDGEKQELLATQFESHHAREVFPCVDEPAAKATSFHVFTCLCRETGTARIARSSATADAETRAERIGLSGLRWRVAPAG